MIKLFHCVRRTTVLSAGSNSLTELGPLSIRQKALLGSQFHAPTPRSKEHCSFGRFVPPSTLVKGYVHLVGPTLLLSSCHAPVMAGACFSCLHWGNATHWRWDCAILQHDTHFLASTVIKTSFTQSWQSFLTACTRWSGSMVHWVDLLTAPVTKDTREKPWAKTAVWMDKERHLALQMGWLCQNKAHALPSGG